MRKGDFFYVFSSDYDTQCVHGFMQALCDFPLHIVKQYEVETQNQADDTPECYIEWLCANKYAVQIKCAVMDITHNTDYTQLLDHLGTTNLEGWQIANPK